MLPPLQLMVADRVVEAIARLVGANSRSPEARAGDLRAQVAGNVTGERRLLECIGRYGVATFDAAIERFLNESETRHAPCAARTAGGNVRRRRLLGRPGGPPQLVRIRLALTLAGGTASLDYCGNQSASR